jgi:hypothetical protein
LHKHLKLLHPSLKKALDGVAARFWSTASTPWDFRATTLQGAERPSIALRARLVGTTTTHAGVGNGVARVRTRTGLQAARRIGRERQSARGFAGESGAGRVRTGARGKATAPVLRARRIALLLFSVVVSPAASTIAVNASRHFKALPRDRSRRRVTDDLQFRWEIIEGGGTLASEHDQEISFQAPATPGLVRLRVTVVALYLNRRLRSHGSWHGSERPSGEGIAGRTVSFRLLVGRFSVFKPFDVRAVEKPLSLALQNRGKSDAWPSAVRIPCKTSRENSWPTKVPSVRNADTPKRSSFS